MTDLVKFVFYCYRKTSIRQTKYWSFYDKSVNEMLRPNWLSSCRTTNFEVIVTTFFITLILRQIYESMLHEIKNIDFTSTFVKRLYMTTFYFSYVVIVGLYTGVKILKPNCALKNQRTFITQFLSKVYHSRVQNRNDSLNKNTLYFFLVATTMYIFLILYNDFYNYHILLFITVQSRYQSVIHLEHDTRRI